MTEKIISKVLIIIGTYAIAEHIYKKGYENGYDDGRKEEKARKFLKKFD